MQAEDVPLRMRAGRSPRRRSMPLRRRNLNLKLDKLMDPVKPDIAVAAVAKAQRRDAEIRSAACGRQDRTGAATGASAWILDWVGVFALIAPAHTSTA